jgi:chemotaxis protein methyltransferase CheR
LPITLLMKYFTQVEDKWQISDEIKSYVKYDYFNLLDPMSRLGVFEIVFCRNVLIYFDQATKGVVLDNMSKLLEKDGFLFLGGAETVIGITSNFVAMPEKRGLYVIPDGPHVAKKDDAGGAQALA